MRSFAEGVGLLVVCRSDPDALDVGELPESESAQLAPVAAALDAAERQPGVGGDYPVDEYCAGVDGGDEPVGVIEIGCPQRGTEPELGGVGDLDGMRRVLRGDDGGHGDDVSSAATAIAGVT